MSLGDLAERVAKQFATETSAPVTEASVIAEEAALEAENNLFTKIRFSWRPEDRAILERIRVSADAMFEEAFADAITTIDDFYLRLRVPEQREVGGQRVVVREADGRIKWVTDELGRPIEDWNQITGQDVEHTLANLERLKFQVAPEVNKLMLEALYARHCAQDLFDEAWGSVMGTQGDKTAKGHRENRTERYHAFFRYYLYSVANTFLMELENFSKLLNNVRYWQTRSQKG